MAIIDDKYTGHISSEVDILITRQKGRSIAEYLGFSSCQQVLIATAISELVRNIVQYAGEGEIVIEVVRAKGRLGISIIASDEGPGIPNIELAVQRGYSTSRGLGLGLAGVKKLMDDVVIISEVNVGTTITVKKWLG